MFLALVVDLAGLAGVMAGNVIGTEPSMALLLGPIVFVVVVAGGLGSIKGALVASIIVGLMQTCSFLEFNLNNLFEYFGYNIDVTSTINHFTSITISQLSPVVPYLLLIIILIARPRGLFGKRDV